MDLPRNSICLYGVHRVGNGERWFRQKVYKYTNRMISESHQYSVEKNPKLGDREKQGWGRGTLDDVIL